MTKKKKTLIFSGGGTGGSVAPLLAVIKDIQKKYPDWKILWFGSVSGIERSMVKKESIKYYPILSGKLRRYFSVKNFLDIFNIIAAHIQVFIYLLILKPHLVMSAGSFVSVPVAFVARLLNIPALSHQQDLRPGLANKLMAPVSRKITVTFAKSLQDYGDKAVLCGNPVRKEFKDLLNNKINKEEFYKHYNLDKNLPIILVLGGGTGSLAVNNLIDKAWSKLKTKIQIVHIVGTDKSIKIKDNNYKAFEFLEAKKIAEIMFLADLVVSRCGLGTITELSYLAKSAIFIPMPNSHQEDNANYILEHKAGLVLNQNEINSESFVENILSLLKNKNKQDEYRDNLYKLIPKEASKKIIAIIEENIK